MSETTQDLTQGQKLVGFTFNPSGDPLVQRAKELAAELADLVFENNKQETSEGYLTNTVRGEAIRQVMTASSAVVRYLTWKW